MRYLYRVVLGLIFFACSYAIFIAGMDLVYAKQIIFLGDIRAVSSIIFGVSGAWLALTYPKALASAEFAVSAESNRDSFQRALDDNKVLGGFIHTMVISIIIIGLSLIIPFIKEVLASFDFLNSYAKYFRALLFYVIALMSLTQLILLVKTLLQSKNALKEHREILAAAQTQDLRRRNDTY